MTQTPKSPSVAELDAFYGASPEVRADAVAQMLLDAITNALIGQDYYPTGEAGIFRRGQHERFDANPIFQAIIPLAPVAREVRPSWPAWGPFEGALPSETQRAMKLIPSDPTLSDIETVWISADGVSREQIIEVWKSMVACPRWSTSE